MTDTATVSVSIVIPVLNAAGYLPRLLPALLEQQPAVREIVLVDSNSTDGTARIAAEFDRVKCVPISNFSHGRARNLGAREASGDIVVLLTQDALPRDAEWLPALLRPFEDPRVAAAYSRQVAGPGASPMETYFLLTHFPEDATVRREKQGDESLSLEKVFFSNVSAAIRRDLLMEYPFDEDLIMSEDQQLSRDLMNAGYAIVYVPGSVVIHYHTYTLKKLFQRYFDSVHSLTVIFPTHDMGTSASLGLRYLWHEALYVARTSPLTLPYYFLFTLSKTLGTIAGHFAPRMPGWLLRRCSMHAYHWEQQRRNAAATS